MLTKTTTKVDYTTLNRQIGLSCQYISEFMNCFYKKKTFKNAKMLEADNMNVIGTQFFSNTKTLIHFDAKYCTVAAV